MTSGHREAQGSPKAHTTEVLEELIHEVDAEAALLVSRTGVKIAHAGALSGLNLHGLSAVLAGGFVGLEKVAEMLGDTEVTIALQQGGRWHIQTMRITDQAFLCVVFEETGRIGRVRLAMGRTREPLQRLLIEIQQPFPDIHQQLGESFNSQALDLIAEKFKV